MSKLLDALKAIEDMPGGESLLISKTKGFTCHDIPMQGQRQDALNDQLRDMMIAGNRLGLYDAVDVVQRLLKDGKR